MKHVAHALRHHLIAGEIGEWHDGHRLDGAEIHVGIAVDVGDLGRADRRGDGQEEQNGRHETRRCFHAVASRCIRNTPARWS